jgi:hypothetical protein
MFLTDDLLSTSADDAAYLGGAALPDLGIIELYIYIPHNARGRARAARAKGPRAPQEGCCYPADNVCRFAQTSVLNLNAISCEPRTN